MKVKEVNRTLFKNNLIIYLSSDREFWESKVKAGFSESLNSIELNNHATLYKMMCSGNSLVKFLDKDILYTGMIGFPGLFTNLMVIEK